ncbi:MAG: ECF transporter S component, partial [Clostridia bacterium]|nr:ECF transporter S component [Clostridia bacterium]
MEKRMLNQKKLQDLTLTAVLAALVLLMSFTPLGYLRVGFVSITFLTIPVAIGAMVVGPMSGLFLGTLFGVTSLIQAIMGDPFGQFLLGVNPFLTGCLCIIPRALMGFLAGVLFKLYVKWIRGEKVFPMIAGGATASLLNTIFFVGGFIGFYLIYRNHPDFGSYSVWGIILSVLTLNVLIELGTGIVVSAAVSRALVQFLPGGRTHGAERDEW